MKSKGALPGISFKDLKIGLVWQSKVWWAPTVPPSSQWNTTSTRNCDLKNCRKLDDIFLYQPGKATGLHHFILLLISSAIFVFAFYKIIGNTSLSREIEFELGIRKRKLSKIGLEKKFFSWNWFMNFSQASIATLDWWCSESNSGG